MASEDSIRTFAALNALAEAKRWPMRCDADLAFERGDLRALLEVWQSKAAGGVPERAAFDMRILKPFASQIVILRRESEGDVRRYKFRLFGSALVKLFGEHTGRYLDEMVSPKMLPSWHAIYDAVLSVRRPLRIVTHFRLPSESFLKGEILAAPMRDGSGEERMILAATYVAPQDVVPPPFG
jgi:hypothetical protein